MRVNLTLHQSQTGFSEMEESWRDLASRSSNYNFFLSWEWLSVWLSQLKDEKFNIRIVELQLNDLTVGLGFVGVDKENNRYLLHKSGFERFDQVWIEYNDFLVDSNQITEESVRKQIMDFLFSQPHSPQSMHIDMTLAKAFQSHQFLSIDTTQELGFKKRLENVTDFISILSSFSKNTRRQIKKSIELLSTEGVISLKECINEKDKLEALAEIGPIHIAQWESSEWGSGFQNEKFVEFHNELICAEQSRVLVLSHNNKKIAYGYFFCFNGTVYFYLSAILKNEDNRIKVGLVFHSLAMEYFAQQEFKMYDFLAGDARYKRSLSDIQYSLYSHRLVKKNWRGYAELFLRKIKRILKTIKLTEK